MTDKPANPQAFPLYGKYISYNGMTLRDYFAGQAMMGIINSKAVLHAAAKDAREMHDTIYDQVAWHSYKHADAMLTERAKK